MEPCAESGVSVLMPVYNGERFLRQAVECILAQTYPDLEFVIVDDGSTDRSREIILSYADPRIRLVTHERNLGLTASLNHGLRLASKELVARQDADDVSHPVRLEHQVNYLRRHPDVVLLGTQGLMIDEQGSRLGPFNRNTDSLSIRWMLLFGNAFIHTSVMFRRGVILEDFGGYNESFRHCEDYELWSRVALEKPVANLEGRWVEHRVHPASKTESSQGLGAEEVRQVIRGHLKGIFKGRDFAEEEVDLLYRYRAGVDGPSVRAFTDLFRRLTGAYRRRFPEAVVSRDFRWTVAWQYVRLASGAFHGNRGLSYLLLAKAVGLCPSIALALVRPRGGQGVAT